AVVLVTDGAPNGCGSLSDVINMATAGYMNGIPTYAVGILSTAVACNTDPNPLVAKDLDTVAAAGGTRARRFDVTNDTASTFATIMADIEADARTPCAYALPRPAASALDPNKVNFVYTPSGASKRVFIPSVPG